MRKFKGIKKFDDILAQAKAAGFEVDRVEFERGSDWIWIRDLNERLVQIKLNICNGMFFAWRPIPDDPWATHLSAHLDNDPLYNEILNLVYQNKTPKEITDENIR